jgi:hypothetical protein
MTPEKPWKNAKEILQKLSCSSSHNATTLVVAVAIFSKVAFIGLSRKKPKKIRFLACEVTTKSGLLEYVCGEAG